jgi:uncharacterized damage-inducible protein DinB
MTTMAKWLDRTFAENPPAHVFPMIVERIRNTPLIAAAKLEGVSEAALTHRQDELWSLKEHVGHLIDLEDLWNGRFDDFNNGVETLRAADMTNRKTYDADHNRTPIAQLLATFTDVRGGMIGRLDAFTDEQITATAQHPRLNQPMQAIQLVHFIAEHDDHHLTIMHRMLTRF